jgi:tight adherence protein C
MSTKLIWALLAAALVFAAITLFVIGIARLLSEVGERQRLKGLAHYSGENKPRREQVAIASDLSNRPQKFLQLLSRMSLPEDGWQNDQLRLKFLQAGLPDQHSPLQYYALRTVLTLVFPLVFSVAILIFSSGAKLIFIAAIFLFLAAMGYYLPELYIRHRTTLRVEEMRQVLPDVIDLLVICTESGLGLDQALGRVSQEVARTSPMAAGEFHLVTLEIRAGAGRATALRNLALRIKLDDLSNLASTMIQADRFGTGIAEALRVQSETMRVKRMQRAEEMAAKVPTKMLLPLVFLIFPSLMIVILGPAMIKLAQVFSESKSWN